VSVILAAAQTGVGTATAGPPFRTDDPEPVETEHWEIDLFSQGTFNRVAHTGALAGVDANYGLAPDLQVHSTFFLGYNANLGEPTSIGMGDLELGVKYRFLSPTEEDWWPQVAIYPLIEVPIGNAQLGLGSGHMQLFVPIWLQKDIGPWTIYGGGGYFLNPGAGNRNYWFSGIVVERKIDDRLTVGLELFHQTSNERGIPNSTGYNIGGSYSLSERLRLLMALGSGLQNVAMTNRFSYYAGLQVTF
jgi:hypothetical protein